MRGIEHSRIVTFSVKDGEIVEIIYKTKKIAQEKYQDLKKSGINFLVLIVGKKYDINQDDYPHRVEYKTCTERFISYNKTYEGCLHRYESTMSEIYDKELKTMIVLYSNDEIKKQYKNF